MSIKTVDLDSPSVKLRIAWERFYQKAKYDLTRIGLFFHPRYCKWHEGMEVVDWNGSPASCPDCGCLLDTKQCRRCGKDFLDFNSNSFDDVMAAPTVTESGDLVCVRCARNYDNPDDQYDDDYGGYDELDRDEW